MTSTHDPDGLALLRAEFFNEEWAVSDGAGGMWWPNEATQFRIQTSEDPAGLALRLCVEEGHLGEWHT